MVLTFIHIYLLQYIIIISACLSLFNPDIKASEPISTIYLFPGQGSDYRIFRDLSWKENYDTICMHLPVPYEKETLREYALRFVPLIDQTENFVLIGVSMGGMICTELTDTLNPKQVILISSAKKTDELPWRYTFQKSFGLYRIVSEKFVKNGALFAQSLIEPDSKNYEIFRIMLGAKDPVYLIRTIEMIINWDRIEFNPEIIHIHGDKDHTIPLRNVKADYIVNDGSHMMVLTRANEISGILEDVLE